MLQVSYIKENREAVITGLKKKRVSNVEQELDHVLEADKKRIELQQKLEVNLEESNKIAKQIGPLMKAGKREEAEPLKARTTSLKEESATLKKELHDQETNLKQLLFKLPNVANSDVPEGNSDEDNEVVAEFNKKIKLPSNAHPHWDLIKSYDIIDFETGVKITGAGFPLYKGKGARLQRALINFFLDEAIAAGYEEVIPPLLINENSGYGTGQLPDKEGQMYHIVEENFFLIPTSEVPITNIFRDTILKTEDLPVKKTGFTPCFRREAGSWGQDVRGLNRLHQFDKVEIIQIGLPEDSYKLLEEMKAHVAQLLEKLELPYRILNLCGGDLGFTAAQTFDFEVYSAAQERWLEVSSVSNCESYQANRLKLRYKDENKKTRLLHTLNGSALALPRIMAAILENNQEENCISIPKVLHPYTGFTQID